MIILTMTLLPKIMEMISLNSQWIKPNQTAWGYEFICGMIMIFLFFQSYLSILIDIFLFQNYY